MGPKLGELSPEETEFLAAIEASNVVLAKQILLAGKINVECLDDHGMTPLAHAAYKGSVELCEMLLKAGADVNSREHKSGYTALMFAALSGEPEVVRTLLFAGAAVHHLNSIGKTASALAAFCGQHQCAAVIHNFFPREDLEYYTKPSGFEENPKLPMELMAPTHKLVMQNNLHPVKLLKVIQSTPLLLQNAATCATVLELECERCCGDKNLEEVKAVKLHYLSRLLKSVGERVAAGDSDLSKFIKWFVKLNDTAFPSDQECFIRECVKTFPHVELNLPKQIVQQLATTPVGSDPSALHIICQTIIGRHYMDKCQTACSTCGEFMAVKTCSSCKAVNYCDAECQKIQWFTHKKVCKRLGEESTKLRLKQIQMKKDRPGIPQDELMADMEKATIEET